MILKRFYDEPLAQASYLVGCQVTGEALVVDPLRDITPYLETAEAEGLTITHVTETHIHADFLSGTRELAARTGARIYLSAEGGPDWTYGFATKDDAILLEDGDHFRVGNIRIDALHTPGHTPEHLTFLVTDTAGADRPMGAFTGDFVFVGDVGRPDLLEKAANFRGTMESAARDLYRSLEHFKGLDDWLQIWPGHGAGSACGKGLGAVPTSTLGYERRFNWAFSVANEDEFVRAVLEGQPEPPLYFAEMKRLNRDGPEVLGTVREPPTLDMSEVSDALRGDRLVIDIRTNSKYASGHLPGSLSIPLDRQFTTYAGWLVPYDRDLLLVAPDGEHGRLAARNLRTIGLDRVQGIIPASALDAWAGAGGVLGTIGRISPSELADRLTGGGVELVDVRWQTEWDAGHIPGARHVPLGYLRDRLEEIGDNRPVVAYCATGSRSGIAASVLRAGGIRDVWDLEGGIVRWRSERGDVTRGERSSPGTKPLTVVG